MKTELEALIPALATTARCRWILRGPHFGIEQSKQVIAGRPEGPDPECRDSQVGNCASSFDAAHRPGM